MEKHMENKDYQQLITDTAPKTKKIRTMLTAFVVGGLICCLGELLYILFTRWLPGMEKKDIAAIVSITLIGLASILTGLGVYDKLGNFAGAGSIVPITGFANSVTSAAMEHNREGIIYGICSKMFIIAGPIIVFGMVLAISAGVLKLIFPGL
jgi:stage V sporulation protein AC